MNKTDGSEDCGLKVGEVVIIREDEKNRNQWNSSGIVQEFIKGKDGVIIGAKLKAGNGLLEQPVPHLYPLELSCDKPAQFERKKGIQS